MRLPLLAVCLLLAVSLGPGPAPAEPAPLRDRTLPGDQTLPRDEAVPEGIAGLTAAEIYELAVQAAQAGEVERYRRLLTAAAEAGHALSALSLARLVYRLQRPDWPHVVLNTLRPLAGETSLKDEAFFWLGLAGERAGPEVPSRQTELWYRLAAWYMTYDERSGRAQLQSLLHYLGESRLGGGLVPWRLRSAVGELLGWQGRDGDFYFERSASVCGIDLHAADLFCDALIAKAASRGHPSARYLKASKQLATRRLPGDAFRRFAVLHDLCLSGSEGVFEATRLLAQTIVANDLGPGHARPAALFQLLRQAERSPETVALAQALEALLSDAEVGRVETALAQGSPVRCLADWQDADWMRRLLTRGDRQAE